MILLELKVLARQFKDINSLLDALQAEINKALRDEVAKITVQTMNEAVKEDVYSSYDPTLYIRREEDGGLSDTRNMTVELIGNDTISITNDTRGNDDYSNTEGWDSGAIDGIIVTGHGYNWSKSKIYKLQPFPRDFYAGTVARLRKGNLLVNTLKAGLRKRGLDVK